MSAPSPSLTLAGADRRREARQAVQRPVKLHCAHTGRYYPAQTCNISRSGVMVEVIHPSLMVPGQRLRMGIAWTNQTVLLEAESLVEATVVRSLGLGDRQHVAIAFDEAQQLALTA